jgi:hypothetical protein
MSGDGIGVLWWVILAASFVGVVEKQFYMEGGWPVVGVVRGNGRGV